MLIRKFLITLMVLLLAVVIYPIAFSNGALEGKNNVDVITANAADNISPTIQSDNVVHLDGCKFTSLDDLKSSLLPFEQKEDITNVLGNNPKNLIGAMNNNDVWRYDLCTVSDYHYTTDHDGLDIDGLYNDQVKYIVFIGFTEDHNITHITIYYKDQFNNINEYRHYADGTIKEMIL